MTSISNCRDQDSIPVASIPPQLRDLQATHPIWNNPLLQACRAGSLSRDDLRYVFSQYYAYSRCFTRYLAALMMNCEDDLMRAQLSQNLWEEGGGTAPERRHANIFRNFLIQGLELDVGAIEFEPASLEFSKAYLRAANSNDLAFSAAFLSMGTEGIVPRLYGDFLVGLRMAGVPEQHLEFFHIHIAGDDDHAETLKQILLSLSAEPDFANRARRGLEHALDLRAGFFTYLQRSLAQKREVA
jgi:pyrroloquinoline quinone (PQQ) biosynthesis protein C